MATTKILNTFISSVVSGGQSAVTTSSRCSSENTEVKFEFTIEKIQPQCTWGRMWEGWGRVGMTGLASSLSRLASFPCTERGEFVPVWVPSMSSGIGYSQSQPLSGSRWLLRLNQRNICLIWALVMLGVFFSRLRYTPPGVRRLLPSMVYTPPFSSSVADKVISLYISAGHANFTLHAKYAELCSYGLLALILNHRPPNVVHSAASHRTGGGQTSRPRSGGAGRWLGSVGHLLTLPAPNHRLLVRRLRVTLAGLHRTVCDGRRLGSGSALEGLAAEGWRNLRSALSCSCCSHLSI
ncbi:hypothetical protein INR49_021814 [Caranx melampygus]|nr:hypothetical protein INR49_021814 [Caranx melampygus]